MSKKLWVAYEALAKRFGPTRVSVDGCFGVDDFKEEIKKKFEITGPASQLSLFQPDGTTEIRAGDSPADYLEGKSSGNALIVKHVVSSQVSNLQNSSSSKAALILQSTMTTEEKESILKDIFEVESKDLVLQAKDLVLQANDELLEALKENIKRIEAERDFLKGALDARHIFETYELRFLNPYPKAAILTRAEKWKKHLVLKPKIREKLEECDQKILWHDKAAEIYDELSRSSHQRAIDIGNGKYIVVIEKSLPKTSYWFLKVLANELYGENVSAQRDIFGEPASSV